MDEMLRLSVTQQLFDVVLSFPLMAAMGGQLDDMVVTNLHYIKM